MARLHAKIMWSMAMSVFLLLWIPFESGKIVAEHFAVPHGLQFLGVTVDVIYVSFVTAYFAIFKTVLMVEARAGNHFPPALDMPAEP